MKELSPTARTVSILGSTGSIGVQTLDVIREYRDIFSVSWLTTNTRVDLLAKQVEEFSPLGVVITDIEKANDFRRNSSFKGIVLSGPEGLLTAAADPAGDSVVSSLVGFAGVMPTIEALKRGARVALANKETLVAAGSVIMPLVGTNGSELIPVDSEHSALYQCIVGEEPSSVNKLILTASGGPFRGKKKHDLAAMTAKDALRHPNWAMGAKITVDCSTLMNKGLEVIEAAWLFNMPAEAIDVVVHPQSIIHSLVEFTDGSVKAQLGLPDMKLPILYALGYPNRIPTSWKRLNLADIGALTFEKPDVESFPCLELAFRSLSIGGVMPAVLNAANEVAVEAFLRGSLQFTAIAEVVEEAMSTTPTLNHPSLEDIIAVDHQTRISTRALLSRIDRK